MKDNRRMSMAILGGGLGFLLVLALLYAASTPCPEPGRSGPFQICLATDVTEIVTTPPGSVTEVVTKPPDSVTEVVTTSPPDSVTEIVTTHPPDSVTDIVTTSPPDSVTEIPTTDAPGPITEACDDRAELVDHRTVPPGTQILPRAGFVKTWQIKNVGTCDWTTSYLVVFGSGDILAASQAVPLSQDVPAGGEVDISVQMTAPDSPGSHTGSWLLKNANGTTFGAGRNANQPLTIEIVVLAVTAVPTLSVDQQAVEVASSVAAQIDQTFGVQIVPNAAVGLDAAAVNETPGQLAGWMAPVVDAQQTYRDRAGLQREVEGAFGIRSPSLNLETVAVLNKASYLYSALPPGKYLLACYTPRQRDCIAVSLQGEEFHVKPETINLVIVDDTNSPPSVAYEDGSIYKCFRVVRRRICVRVF